MRKTLFASAGLLATLALTGSALAAGTPGATTGATAAVTQTSATLKGSVNPHGSATSYDFQYGKTAAYGAQTGPASAGAGGSAVAVAAPVVGLEPATTYHYRLVASNAAGTVVGGDRSFKTPRQPLGFTLAATPNPVPFGGPTTIVGQLTGTGGGGRGIQLQQRAFPYTVGFANVGNPQVADATGHFTFPVLALTANTQYRVVTTGPASITSPIVLVGSAVTIHLAVSAHSIRSHQLVRFAGTVYPREDGALYAVQKQRGTSWVTIGGSSLRADSASKSKFAKSIRLPHSGVYRVYVGVADGSHVSNASTSQTIRIR
jgi:hypothetical protein